ncbi:hypothetical protein CTI12_AA097860 [Artemisia annua]|uniref:Uncharacterized protein n=1 Tax=Artemisia annua TaxID=35608 RepID=A0A2U1PY79_ARTAN|nr:hypothetical protein CTI12_AA097860 [Artemisia annua]
MIITAKWNAQPTTKSSISIIADDIGLVRILLECLRTSRHNWEKVKHGEILLWASNLLDVCCTWTQQTSHNFRVMRHRPAMRSWNTQAMRRGLEWKSRKLLGKT